VIDHPIKGFKNCPRPVVSSKLWNKQLDWGARALVTRPKLSQNRAYKLRASIFQDHSEMRRNNEVRLNIGCNLTSEHIHIYAVDFLLSETWHVP
jgi:hypothetical protein